jgi:CheY-like chemotaxis protein
MNISHFSRSPIFVLGDLRQGGDNRAYEALNSILKLHIRNKLMFEVFTPASRSFLEQIARVAPGFYLDLSPDSHDPIVRRACGKRFNNDEIEQTIKNALELGCSGFNLFFMTGLPRQTSASVMDTIDYCEHLLARFKGDKRLALFIGPLAPFLDPGSLAYENPERYGYHVLYHTLAEIRQALTMPSWKYTLNYETRWMSRQQITDSTYEAIRRLTQLKAKYEQIPQALADAQIEHIDQTQAMENSIDAILKPDGPDGIEEIAKLKPAMDRLNGFQAVEKGQLKMAIGCIGLKHLNALWHMIT